MTFDYRKKCRDHAYYAYGTSRLFERRAYKLKRGRTWITFLGIAGPIFLGATVAAFGAQVAVVPVILVVVGLVAVSQVTISAWAIVNRWDEEYEYAVESFLANTAQFNSWNDLFERNPQDIEAQHERLLPETRERERRDLSHHVSDSEKKFAAREALKYFNLPCPRCNKVPSDSVESACDVCGDGKWRFPCRKE